MFGNIGPVELILIAGIALIVIGPEKFPEFAKIAIRTVRDLRGYVTEVKADINKEMSAVRKEVKSLSRYDPETYIDALAGTTKEEEKKPASSAATNQTPTTDATPGAAPSSGASPTPGTQAGEEPAGGDAVSDGKDVPADKPENPVPERMDYLD